MRYRIKIIIKGSNKITYVPQWKTHWFSFWNNELFYGYKGYTNITNAYNDIKRWQIQEELFSKPKLKKVRYINIPRLNSISTSENDIIKECNQSPINTKTTILKK